MVGSQSNKIMLLDWKKLYAWFLFVMHKPQPYSLLTNTMLLKRHTPLMAQHFFVFVGSNIIVLYVLHVTLGWEIGANGMGRRCHWARPHKAPARLETKKQLPNTQLWNGYLTWLSYLLQVCILTYSCSRIVYKHFKHKDQHKSEMS